MQQLWMCCVLKSKSEGSEGNRRLRGLKCTWFSLIFCHMTMTEIQLCHFGPTVGRIFRLFFNRKSNHMKLIKLKCQYPTICSLFDESVRAIHISIWRKTIMWHWASSVIVQYWSLERIPTKSLIQVEISFLTRPTTNRCGICDCINKMYQLEWDLKALTPQF